MIKVYTYPDEVYPGGNHTLTGPDVQPVNDPEDADVLMCPAEAFALHRGNDKHGRWDQFWNEPAVQARPDRVILFDCSDDAIYPPVPGVIYMRCGAPQSMVNAYPGLVPFPWPARDIGRWNRADETPAYDVAFCGWKSPLDLTPRACASVVTAFGDRSKIVLRDEFHGHLHPNAGEHEPDTVIDDADVERREVEYRDLLFGAKLSLVPQSIVGVPRYRVNEALACSRVPVIIGHDYAHPFPDRIPWDEIAVHVHSDDVDRTGEIVAEWLEIHDWQAVGKVGRRYYEQYLDPKIRHDVMTMVVRERLGLA